MVGLVWDSGLQAYEDHHSQERDICFLHFYFQHTLGRIGGPVAVLLLFGCIHMPSDSTFARVFHIPCISEIVCVLGGGAVGLGRVCGGANDWNEIWHYGNGVCCSLFW